jgi:hypothetical protein
MKRTTLCDVTPSILVKVTCVAGKLAASIVMVKNVSYKSFEGTAVFICKVVYKDFDGLQI